jgi:quercetin dioxygenase-like cupin family protein
LEITSVNQHYLGKNVLKVRTLQRGFAWLDTGTHDSLSEASTFIEVIEKRQGLKVACLEEIAFKQGWINAKQLEELAKPMMKNNYGKYLLELAKRFISQLERNQNSPSIGTLLDIIQCLGTTPAEFFTDEEPEQIVFEKDDYFEKISEDGNKMIEWIIPNAQKNSMEPVRLTLKPGGSSDTHLPHAGEEFGYVLKGTVRVFYGGRTYTVRAGESFYFQAGKKHRLENNGNRDAILIWVSTPPSF